MSWARFRLELYFLLLLKYFVSLSLLLKFGLLYWAFRVAYGLSLIGLFFSFCFRLVKSLGSTTNSAFWLTNCCVSSSLLRGLLEEIDMDEDVETEAEVDEQEDRDEGEMDCELT